MPRPKLTIGQVRRIKTLLSEVDENGKKKHSQTKIAKKYGVQRSAICKIALGMKNPFHKNARWGDIEIG